MNKLENIVKSKEYLNLIMKNFEEIGFEIINNETQTEKFNKDFIEFGLDIKDQDHYAIHKFLNKTFWFCRSEDSEFFGLYFDPKINEYTCIVQLDNEWNIKYMSNDVNSWINKFFRKKEGRNIPERVIAFKADTNSLNKKIFIFPEINDSELLSLYY